MLIEEDTRKGQTSLNKVLLYFGIQNILIPADYINCCVGMVFNIDGSCIFARKSWLSIRTKKHHRGLIVQLLSV